MTPEAFQKLAESFGLPVAMLVTALLTVLTAWSRGWFVSAAQYREMQDELRSRSERAEDNARYWQDAWKELAGLAHETQEVARTVVREVPRRERPR